MIHFSAIRPIISRTSSTTFGYKRSTLQTSFGDDGSHTNAKEPLRRLVNSLQRVPSTQVEHDENSDPVTKHLGAVFALGFSPFIEKNSYLTVQDASGKEYCLERSTLGKNISYTLLHEKWGTELMHCDNEGTLTYTQPQTNALFNFSPTTFEVGKGYTNTPNPHADSSLNLAIYSKLNSFFEG